MEDVTSYSCFSISLPLLLATYLILALIRGVQTNSNVIRKNLVFCVFLVELLYFVALKARKSLVHNEVSKKKLSNLIFGTTRFIFTDHVQTDSHKSTLPLVDLLLLDAS